MSRFSFSSLRVRLLLLVLLAIIPALGLILYTAAMQRSSAAVEAKENALRLARLTASDQEQLVEGAHQLLISLAQLPQVRQRDSDACDTLFADLLKQYPQYAVLGAVDAKGNPFCSAIPIRKPFNSADRAWFQRAFLYRGFAIGDYAIGRASGKASLNLGYPVIDDRGDVQAVVLAALDLAWLNRLAAKARLPEGSVLSMTDHNGVILARHPHPEKWVGKSMRETSIFSAIMARREEGTTSAVGVDGVERLYAFTPLHGMAQAGEVYLSVGIPQKVAFADAAAILKRNLVGLAVVAVLALVAAWFGSDLFILRQVDALASATKRLGDGDLGARTKLSYEKGELGQLARTFDTMAASMEQLITERTRAEQRLERLLGELSSLYAALTPLAPADSLNQMLEKIIDRLMEATGADAALIRLRDNISGTYHWASQRGFPDHYLETVVNAPPAGAAAWVFQNAQPIIASDIAAEPRLKGKIQLQVGLHSCVMLPLLVQNEVRGIIHLASRELGYFNEGQRDHLMAIARQMGIGLENRELFEKIQHNLERVRALGEIEQAITSTLDLRNVLDVLMEKIDLVLPYAAVTLRLFNKEKGVLEPLACRNLDEAEWKAERWKGGHGVPNVVFEKKAPWTVSNVQTDPRVPDPEFFRKHGLVSYLGVPLIAKGDILGVLGFYTKEQHKFTGEEVEFLMTLAGQAALAVHNSQLHEHIKGQAAELERANRMQADFTAMIAHDLRSPLTAMHAAAAMLEDGLMGPVSEEQQQWLAKIQTHSRNLVELVNDFLDLSKIEAGQIDLAKEEVDLKRLIDNSMDSYLPLANDKRISLTSHVAPALPRIQADPRRLDQVLGNLISNAAKFTGEGGKIEVEACRNGSEVKICVRDTGAGISALELDSLFEKYHQTTSGRNSGHKGTGLGLVICKMIVEAHGGRIWAESEEGKGATFTLTIPFDADYQKRSSTELV